MTKILMVGLHQGYLDLFRANDDLELFVLEEPELYRRDRAMYDSPAVRGLRLGAYQQSDGLLAAVTDWHHEVGFQAVVPAWEYGVVASGVLAEAWGLRWPGGRALGACTDKIQLRETLNGSSIAQPRWAEVRDARDVAGFHQGHPVIVKPTNRHASVGVIRVDTPDDVEAAWIQCVGAEESRTVVHRPRTGRFIVEEYVPGYQVSTETLVRDGVVVYCSVDLMATAGGPYFPILGVTVPAPIPPAEYAAAAAAAHRLAAVLEVSNGMIHSEWKVHDGQCVLIESAARVPGAFTPELAERAYCGFNMYRAQIRNLASLDPEVPGPASAVAGARWFHPVAGTVVSVEGDDVLQRDPAVFLHRIKVSAGDVVPVCRDGWQRVGYFAAAAPTADELATVIDRILTTVVITVVPTR